MILYKAETRWKDSWVLICLREILITNSPRDSHREVNWNLASLHYSYHSLFEDVIWKKEKKKKRKKKKNIYEKNFYSLFSGFTANNNGKLQPKKLGARDERVHISLDVPTFDLSFYLYLSL